LAKKSSHNVSIIILNWNGINFTRDCIKSVREQTKSPDYEIIVVDNGSKQHEVKELQELHRKKLVDRLILNPENRGFSGGNNQGMLVASGDYLMLLNNDILVKEKWLEILVEAAESDPKIGLVGPKITLHHTPNTCFGGGKISDSGAAKFGYETARCEAEQIGGAALMFKRGVYEKIGGLDEGFNPIYFEESDFCTRVSRAGFKILFVPESEVIHFENAAMKTQPSKRTFVTLNKNRLRYELLHFGRARLVKAFFWELLRFCRGILRLKPHWLLAAYWITLRKMPEILRRRNRYNKGDLRA